MIQYTSGKGGTGKTTISVALAHELSKSGRVLLVDLDLFNRGLSGLFASADVADISLSSLLASLAAPADSGAASLGAGDIVSIDDNLFCARCPEIDPSILKRILEQPEDDVRTYLEAFIQTVTDRLNCDFVVFDCHGGPDAISFAACQVAAYTIMVSEPDRHSVHGTLNFVRMLRPESESRRCDLRLVFNKVNPAFSAPFLTRFYKKYLAKDFGDSTLLGIFPFEDFVAKIVGQYPVPSKLYPFSLLARKTELLVYELLANRGAVALRPVPLIGLRLVRKVRFAAVGKSTRLGDSYRLFSALLVVVVASQVGTVAREVFGGNGGNLKEDIDILLKGLGLGLVDFLIVAFAGVILGLITASVVARWIRSLTDAFTFCMRDNRQLRSVVPLVTILGILAGSTYVWGEMGRLGFEMAESDRFEVLARMLELMGKFINVPGWAVGLVILSMLFPVLAGTFRGVMALGEEFVRFLETRGDVDKRWETIGRVAVLVSSGAAGFWGWRL